MKGVNVVWLDVPWPETFPWSVSTSSQVAFQRMPRPHPVSHQVSSEPPATSHAWVRPGR